MKLSIPLTDEQTKLLQPMLDARRSQHNPHGSVAVCAIKPGVAEPDGILVGNLVPSWRERTWVLHVTFLPGERRDAVRAACAGELKLRRKKPQKPQPVTEAV